MTGLGSLSRRVRLATTAILGGLAIEVLSLTWVGPEAFLIFALGSGLLIGGGILLYLASLLRGGP